MTNQIKQKVLANHEHIIEDLIRLRDEFALKAFDENGYWLNPAYAEAVLKINSCLFSGYPKMN